MTEERMIAKKLEKSKIHSLLNIIISQSVEYGELNEIVKMGYTTQKESLKEIHEKLNENKQTLLDYINEIIGEN